MRLVLLFLLSLVSASAGDFWKIGTVPTSPSDGYIGIASKGYSTLNEAILNFEKKAPDASLKHVWMALYFDSDSKSQSEVKVYLEKHYPKLLSAALKSSGNLHNPKVTPLREPYEEAILSTSFVASLNEALSHVGYKVSGASSEKFFIDSRAHKFSAAVWLYTAKTEQAGAPNPLPAE